jgi:hypothetical protein
MNVNHLVWLAAQESLSGVAPDIPGKSIALKPLATRGGHIVSGKVLCFPSERLQLSMNGFHHACHAAPVTARHPMRHKHALGFEMVDYSHQSSP